VAISHIKQRRIVRDPKICGGEPVIKGTRVTLRTVLASLATGDMPEAILADFPILGLDDVPAAIAFPAASLEEDLSTSAVPFNESKFGATSARAPCF
jgi:uncharacterized protein (DUF433 family)